MSLVPAFSPVLSLFNLGGAVFDQGFEDVASSDDYYSLAWHSGGLAFSAASTGTADIRSYDVDAAYDIGGAAVVGGRSVPVSVATSGDYGTGMAFNIDGTKVFVMRDAGTGESGTVLEEFSLSSPYTGALTYVQKADGYAGGGARFGAGGGVFYYSAGSSVYQKTCGTAFDPFSAGTTESENLSATVGAITGFGLGRSGTRLLVCDAVGVGNYIREYSLTTPYDVTTARETGVAVDFSSRLFRGYAAVYSPDGARLLIQGVASNGARKTLQYETTG